MLITDTQNKMATQINVVFLLSTTDPTLNMKNLLICLNAVDNWKMLGLQLNISNGELTRLEGANQSNPDLCKENMLKLWLCKEGNPSWMTLASALEDINLRIPASKIRTKYLQVRKEVFLMLYACIN